MLSHVEFIPVTGDLSSALLLAQISYWFKPAKNGKSKLTIERDGKRWLAKSRSDLKKETGLTDWKLRVAMEKLVALGLVQSEIHLFQNKTTPHLFLNEERLAMLMSTCEDSSKPDVSIPQNRSGDNLKTGCEVSSNPISITTAVNTADITVAPCGALVEEDLQNTVGKENLAKVIPMATAKEILNRFKDRENKPKTINVSALAILWKKRMAEEFGGFQKDLTGKEIGQLKLYLTKSENPERAYQTLDFMLTNWGTFAFEAKSMYGLSVAPSQPVVGFVLQYFPAALQLIAQPQKKVATSVGVTLEQPKPQAVSKEPKATKEQIAAALAKIKKGPSC